MTMLRASLVSPAVVGELWTSVEVVETTGSTNTDLLARGGPEGQVLVAEEQTAGRGRMGRSWVSQPGEALTFSVLLRPVTVPASRRGWLPLLAGIAVATAVRSAASVAAALKWPNDVLAGDRKLAGILAEQSGSGSASGDALVIGIGLNVATPSDALPVSPGGLHGTSLLAEGAADVGREPLLVELLRRFEQWYLPFRSDPDPARTGLLAEYRSLCGTLGRQVRVDLPGGKVLSGIAEDVDADGRLLVREDATAGVSPVSAGDIIHLR
jgi:BirA family biotin operon repressor/biotin-[acetyl-CoA-carboxylase] ligase